MFTTCIKTDRPDQMPHFVASDPSLNCLPLIKQFLDTLIGSKMDVQILGQVL